MEDAPAPPDDAPATLQPFLEIIARGDPLARDEAEAAMGVMMRGAARPEHTAALLMGLRTREETLDELVGFTAAMRRFAVPVDAGDPAAIDLCGTGGDGAGTFNISTTAALVAAGAGATVAKHGNRSVSSKSGSADVLEALGVKIDLEKPGVEFCLREVGLAFLFAPYFHPAMRYVMPVRRALGVRTFFNILGPLCNPAGVTRQLVGAFSTRVAERMVQILARLGADHVVTCHAADGLDELSLCDATTVFTYDGEGAPVAETVGPERHGFARTVPQALAGGTADANAAILRGILDGSVTGPKRDVVVLNAAYALRTSGRFDSLDACLAAAEASLDDGAALAKLDALADASHDAPV
jgi:anthranilate phosphoribosyltransferase